MAYYKNCNLDMKKFFENLSEKINDAAFETQLDDFVCEFDAVNKPAEIVVSVKSRKVIHSNGNVSSYPYYNVDKINIYNEDGEDVSSKYPLFCQRVKDCVPSYKDVENDLMEANMSYTELYFGSEANYLRYKYGN